ncbi:MAG TPA: hypothetical protein VFQ53_15650 [Kofleriaceae bacterium]|nr:hypothetical protein [Kofleriaceae bacterium]
MKHVALALLAVPAIAHADANDRNIEHDYEPIASIGQLGFGVVGDHCLESDGGCPFDGTFQLGKVWAPIDRVRPGGFLELRTVGFDTFEAAVGPQVQLRLRDQLGLQLRAGVGGVADGDSYALAGAQLGTQHVGFSITTRRDFETHEMTTSAQLHISSLVAVFPFAVGIFLAST